MVHSTNNLVKLAIYLTKLLRSSKIAHKLFFLYYILNKIDQLLKMQLKLCCVPDEIFSYLILKYGQCSKSCIDQNLYIICNPNVLEKSQKWFHLCSKVSEKRYKVAVVSTSDIPRSFIYISESMNFNASKQLNAENLNNVDYFLGMLFLLMAN